MTPFHSPRTRRKTTFSKRSVQDEVLRPASNVFKSTATGTRTEGRHPPGPLTAPPPPRPQRRAASAPPTGRPARPLIGCLPERSPLIGYLAELSALAGSRAPAPRPSWAVLAAVQTEVNPRQWAPRKAYVIFKAENIFKAVNS